MEFRKLKHLAIIVDGNRRFAKNKGLPAWKGHEYGAEIVDKLFDWCKELDIKEVTLYILSTENLKRDAVELNFLFRLFKNWFKRFEKDKVRIRFIGDLSLVPQDIQELTNEIEKDTKNYDNFKINFCFAYGGRLELVNAFNKLRNKEKITEEDITNALWLSSEPDLIIRTGNVIRTSNFLPWQAIYSEWIFLDKMWPEFTREDLIACIEEFENRKRNLGE